MTKTQSTWKVPFARFHQEVGQYSQTYAKLCERVIESGWYILGQEVEAFEREFASYLNTKEVIGVANGLEAIQIILLGLGVGRGDEVITTPLTAAATTLAIQSVGAQPVFVDVGDDGNLDVALVEQAITFKTKAIIPVHLYGQPVHLSEFARLVQAHKLYLVEDACQAHGSTYEQQKVGGFGNAAAWSFYPTKNLGAIGDAGAISTNDAELAHRCRLIRDYGQDYKYHHVCLGLNSRLDELQAAFLRHRLTELDKNNGLRRHLALRYQSKLNGISQVRCVSVENVDKGTLSNYHLFVIEAEDRDGLKVYLKEAGIETLVHYPCSLTDQPCFSGQFGKVVLPRVKSLVAGILSLPCSPSHTEQDIDLVCETVAEFFTKQNDSRK